MTLGFQARMKIVAAHFPMKVQVKDSSLLIENFLGEKYPRTARLIPGVEAKVDGEFVILTGHDIEEVGQSAANIETATKIRDYDLRVFQDGIYIIERARPKEANASIPDEKAPIEPEDDPEPVAEDVEEPTEAPQPTPKKSQTRAPRTRRPAVPAAEEKEEAGEEEEKDEEEDEGPKAPRRPTLDPETARLLAVRHAADQHRPLFVREQAHRYYAVGRTGKWRTPRGLQSKQRRHYGYRPVVVRIGYRSPARVRGLTPTGFRPVDDPHA